MEETNTPFTGTLIVCDNQYNARALLRAWKDSRPDQPARAVCLNEPAVMGIPMKLPGVAAVSDAPRICEPGWDVAAPVTLFSTENGITTVDGFEAFGNARKIICAVWPRPRDAFAFRNYTRHFLDDPKDRRHFERWYFEGLVHGHLVNQVRRPGTTEAQGFRDLVNRGEAKRFFEWNWALNAGWAYSPIFRDLGLTPEPSIFSKLSLQLLLDLAGSDEPTEEAAIYKRLWKGWTGNQKRKPVIDIFGSPLSRAPILRRLEAMGLIERSQRVSKEGTIELLGMSSLGHDLVARLHPDSRDPELPYKIAEWGMKWPQSRPDMEAYLLRFFGRQQQFNA